LFNNRCFYIFAHVLTLVIVTIQLFFYSL
jgi:hypothetical protein